MNKNEERAAFDAVFGRFGLTVTETEEPDFVCSMAGAEVFGVEVTEFFLTESDARLQKIPNYAVDLIAGGKYRHKNDQNEIEVKEVTYIRAETGERIQLKAIPRPIPSHLDSLSKLLAAIAEKNGKHTQYQKRVKPIDLVVHDVDCMLRFKTIRQVMEPIIFIHDSAIISGAPFREVYLLTRSVDKGAVAVPLRANLFVGAILFFSNVYQEYRREAGGPSSVGEYLSALGQYLVTRFPEVEFFLDEGERHIVLGSHSWTYSGKQEVRLVDRSLADRSAWKPLSSEVETSNLPTKLREMIEVMQTEWFGCCELYFPAASPSASSSDT